MAPVPAVKRALRVLELLVQEGEPMTLTEIAERTGIPTASCHAIIHTLAEADYLQHRTEGRALYWEPTLALYHLGALIVSRYGIRDTARPYLRKLSEELDLPAHLGVLVGNDVVYVEKAATASFIQFDTFPGKRSPFGSTALGRAIVSALPDSERAKLVDPRDTALRKALKQSERDGFAREDGEESENVGCVAAPIFDADGQVVASVGVTGFSDELFRNGDVPAAEKIVDTAGSISRELGFRWGDVPRSRTR
ncbi:MAG: IclR family transcriptional regulator [Solirubrobacterales bacterium]